MVEIFHPKQMFFSDTSEGFEAFKGNKAFIIQFTIKTTSKKFRFMLQITKLVRHPIRKNAAHNF
jgi:hypothetical protein